MKTIYYLIVLLFSISCASPKMSYRYSQYTINELHAARASESAIGKDSMIMKKTSCCAAAKDSAQMSVLKNKSEFIITGNRQNDSLKIVGNGSVPNVNYNCIDRKNQFEECFCVAVIPNKSNPVIDAEIKNSQLISGWVSPNTYRSQVSARASQKAISVNSISMKENTCIEAAYNAGIRNMLFGLMEEQKIANPNLEIKSRLPFLYMKSCDSKNDFLDCTCDLAFHEAGLKDRFIKELKR
jgi:hypothetical protein